MFSHPLNDYSNENSRELILSCVYGPVGSADNGRFGNRLPYFFGGDYANASWGIPEFCWEYPTKSASRVGYTNDFGFDLYVNKQADSRYQKSFHVEYVTALRGGDSNSIAAMLLMNGRQRWLTILMSIFFLVIIVLRGEVVKP